MAVWIDIKTSLHELNLFDDHRLLNTYPIGVGKMVTPTPAGTYTIINKQVNPGGPYGGLWMGLSRPHYGIHGTNDPSSIGKDVSHGCIRLFNSDVLELSSKAPVGTQVVIHR
ncbi:L,D-transpeptidase [Sporolactobacillus kofuensis]|uniref:L,D-transpeptidase n=1 Tax=Sporolactobacillus kofuensis TaxID=269672 RepID=A0ABW1W9S2_9BACL|nr:L,D-transpeptidase [Sporolactobacillus kofuensis]MCO7175968.1 L,D-transpeptidase [Sporolactobacillus kofuensis]